MLFTRYIRVFAPFHVGTRSLGREQASQICVDTQIVQPFKSGMKSGLNPGSCDELFRGADQVGVEYLSGRARTPPGCGDVKNGSE